jgi:hypothetical protein
VGRRGSTERMFILGLVADAVATTTAWRHLSARTLHAWQDGPRAPAATQNGRVARRMSLWRSAEAWKRRRIPSGRPPAPWSTTRNGAAEASS